MIRDTSLPCFPCNVQWCEGELPLACVSWSVYTVCSFKAGSLSHTGTVSDCKGLHLSAALSLTHTHPDTHIHPFIHIPQAKYSPDQRVHSLKRTCQRARTARAEPHHRNRLEHICVFRSQSRLPGDKRSPPPSLFHLKM